MNKSGSNTDPSGTPRDIGHSDQSLLLTDVYCSLSDINEQNQSFARRLMPLLPILNSTVS